MVTTRLQEEGHGESGVSDRLDADMVKSWNGKRKSEELVDGMPEKTGKKRRRSSPMEEVVADRERTGPINSFEAQMNNTSHEGSETVRHILPLTDESTNMTSTDAATEENSYARHSVREDALHLDEDLDRVADTEQSRSNNKLHYRSNTSKKRTVADNQTHSFNRSLIAGSRFGVQPFIDPNTLVVKKPIHKRFGSEELQKSILEADGAAKHDEPVGGDQAEAESDSENDVPEIVTASVGLSQARSIAAEEAKAVETQLRAKKEKRRQRDAHLKEQATGAKKKRQSHAHNVSDLDGDQFHLNDEPAANTEDSKPHLHSRTKTSFKRGEPLPKYLPDELLAKEPPVRLPTPPPHIMTLDHRKKRFIDADPKPPKDIKRGSVIVRVLENKKSNLPPRASKASKLLKESWLAGHRGRNDVASQRKKIGGGFLRS